MALQPISTAYLINPSHQSVYPNVYPLPHLSLPGNGVRYEGNEYTRNCRVVGRPVLSAVHVVGD
jgi:hypothetical protein